MLTKMGHTVTVAYDGNEALIHHLERRFDLILMDVEMPEMDGVQATAIIRAREEKGCARTPIIALTANAMRGDEERFLAAGMDGYLAKPVRGEALKGAVEKFTARCEGDPGATKESPSAESGNDVLDRDALMETVYRDPETLVTLIDLFVTNALESLDAIKAAVEAGDAKALFRGAHKLKGMSLTMQGRLAAAAALSLETMGRDEDLAGAAEAVAELESRLNHFIDALKAFSEDTRRAVIMQ
jgi:CheY-like chemotaxis protein